MPADPGLRNRAGHMRTAVQLSPETQASSQTQRPPRALGPELGHRAAQETSSGLTHVHLHAGLSTHVWNLSGRTHTRTNVCPREGLVGQRRGLTSL